MSYQTALYMGADVTNLKHNQSPLRGVAYLFISVTFIGAKFIFSRHFRIRSILFFLRKPLLNFAYSIPSKQTILRFAYATYCLCLIGLF